MTEDAAIYCLAGKIRNGNHVLKAGQCLKDNKVQTFLVSEFIDKFPIYAQQVVHFQLSSS